MKDTPQDEQVMRSVVERVSAWFERRCGWWLGRSGGDDLRQEAWVVCLEVREASFGEVVAEAELDEFRAYCWVACARQLGPRLRRWQAPVSASRPVLIQPSARFGIPLQEWDANRRTTPEDLVAARELLRLFEAEALAVARQAGTDLDDIYAAMAVVAGVATSAEAAEEEKVWVDEVYRATSVIRRKVVPVLRRRR